MQVSRVVALLRSVGLPLILCGLLQAQQPLKPAAEATPRERAEESAPQPAREAATAESEKANAAQRAALNLLGEVDASGGEGRRNENVRMTLIDNNVLKELNTRMGTTATVITDFRVEQGYFGTEFGGQPKAALHVEPNRRRGVHGNANWTHNNSIFSARSFFQAGDVQPARTNDYGFNLGLPLKDGALTLSGAQRKLRGQVNGNVLVPTPEERTPLTTDPATRAMVLRILAAYPDVAPNRTDVNPRALNTNAPQNIDNDRFSAGLDQPLGTGRGQLALRYNFVLQKVEAFQMVGGQNPDTTTRNHTARATWSRAWSAATTVELSAGFERIGSLLVPEETSIGPFLLFSRDLGSIGPGGDIPIDRTQNFYRTAARLRQGRGDHNVTLGYEASRRQVNGYDSLDHRGMFSFRSDFGRDAVANLLWGTPSSYSLGLGHVHRGFRDWTLNVYLGDEWRLTPKLSMTTGLRFQPVTRPREVDNLSTIPYASDWNNVAGTLGFAYRLPAQWGVLRTAYGLHYGEIFPATFLQLRANPPGNIHVTVQAPYMPNPLRDFKPSDLTPNARTSIYQLASDLKTPYVHQYSFAWQLSLPKAAALELGYTGSRSHKLLTMWYLNRARPVPGIPLTTATINERRPDPGYYNVHHIHNGSRGYFDAAKATFRLPRWAGFTLDASYWFSKAIDLGANYTNTASGRDGRATRSPTDFDFQNEMRGLSDFDQPHALQWTLNYATPSLAGRNPWLRRLFGSWQVSSIVLLKSGTPFSVESGADSPGYGNVDGSGGDTPNLVDRSVLGRSIDHPDTSVSRLPLSAFAFFGPGETRGNLGRNTFRKDGVANINAGLSKRWSVGNERTLLLRAESLNFFNHPQFSEPGSDMVSHNFAQITNTLNDGRTFRFTLQFDF